MEVKLLPFKKGASHSEPLKQRMIDAQKPSWADSPNIDISRGISFLTGAKLSRDFLTCVYSSSNACQYTSVCYTWNLEVDVTSDTSVTVTLRQGIKAWIGKGGKIIKHEHIVPGTHLRTLQRRR